MKFIRVSLKNLLHSTLIPVMHKAELYEAIKYNKNISVWQVRMCLFNLDVTSASNCILEQSGEKGKCLCIKHCHVL
jgi:hypothetical protein